METDIQILIIAMILSGLIYGSISGWSIYHGGNQDRQPIGQWLKLVLMVVFPFTLAAVGSAKAVIWWLGRIECETFD